MKLRRPLFILLSIALLVPLVAHGYLGFYSRYIADDFCTAAQYRTLGFLPSIQAWRVSWSGRYAFFFFMDITHLIGPRITPYMTSLALLVWLIALYALFRKFFRIIQDSVSFLEPLLLAFILLFSTLEGSPDIYQSLYWQTGLVTYVFPLILLTAYGALLLIVIFKRGKISWSEMAFSAGIAFVAGGFSETFASVQIVAVMICLGIVFLYVKEKSRRSGLLFLGSGLLGAVLALILVVTAPGNSFRLDIMPDRLSAPELVFWTLRHSLAFSVKSLISAPVSSAIALLVPGLLAFYSPLSPNREEPFQFRREKIIPFMVGIPIMAFLLICGTIAPSIYATAAYPAERVLITARFFLVLALIFWGFLLGLLVRNYFQKAARLSTLIGIGVVLLLVFGAVISSQKTLSRLPDAKNFASLWDKRDVTIRQAVDSGVQELAVASLPHISPGLGELSKDPSDWVNQCLASSYGLIKVIAK